MKKILYILFLLPLFLSAQESGFHGYGDIIRAQEINSDTFELRIVFTGGNTIDGQYLIDSLKIGDKIFSSCAPYIVVSISLQTSGIGIFRISDPYNKGMPVLGSRCAVYRETTNKNLVRTNISNAMNYGISPNELNCLTQNLISQIDTLMTTEEITLWAQIERSDTIGAIAIAGVDSVGAWSDSLRFWQGKLRIGLDTAATLADVRALGFNETGTANTLPLWATTTTLGDSWLSQSGNTLSLATTKLQRYIGHTTAGRPTGVAGNFGYNTDDNSFEVHDGTEWSYLARSSVGGFTSVSSGGYIPFGNSNGNGTLNESINFQFQDDNGGRIIIGDNTYKNINIGTSSGNSITTGTQNINIGTSSGQSITTGANNNNFGRGSGQFLKTGSNNNNYGLFAGFGGTNASYTDINNFGSGAGISLITGIGSNHFGRNAARAATSSTYSNIFGHEAVLSATDLSISNLNCFGYRAFNAASVLDDCIGMGYSVADSNSYAKVLVIGNYADAVMDNEIVIGNYDRTEVSGKILLSDRLRTGNYIFNIDQDTTGLDGYVLTYNEATDEIELQAGASGADGNGFFSSSNDGGTISTGFNAILTDVLTFDNVGGPLLEIDGTNDNIEVFGSIISNTGSSAPSLWTDVKMEMTLGNDAAENDFSVGQFSAIVENTTVPASQFIAAGLSANSRAEGTDFSWLVGMNNRAEVINASDGKFIYGLRQFVGSNFAGDVERIWGQNNETRKSNSGTIGDIRGINDLVNLNSNTGTITSAYGIRSEIARSTGTSGTITDLYGISSILSHNNTGTLTNLYGLYIDHSSVTITPSGVAYSALIDSPFKMQHTGYGDGSITGTAAYVLGSEADHDIIDVALTSLGVYAGSGSLSGNTTITAASNDFTISTTGDANTLTIDGSTGNIGIQSTFGADAELTVGGTNGIEIPSGTAAEAPGGANEGTIRFDTDADAVTGLAEGEWAPMQQNDKVQAIGGTATYVVRKNVFLLIDMLSSSQTLTLDPTNLANGSTVTIFVVSTSNTFTLDSDIGNFVSTSASSATKSITAGAVWQCKFYVNNWYIYQIE